MTPLKPAGWPIARHPRIAHFMPYLVGDSLGAIPRARRLGFLLIDQNGNTTVSLSVWILHWRRFRLQFPFYWTGRRTKSGREIRRPVPRSWPRYFTDLNDHQASRLRSSLIGGRRPHLAVAHMVKAADEGIVWCLEGKGGREFSRTATWDTLQEQAERTGVRMVFMCLTTWANWRQMVQQAVDHGFAVAVLPRTPKPADWSHFAQQGVQVWGEWR